MFGLNIKHNKTQAKIKFFFPEKFSFCIYGNTIKGSTAVLQVVKLILFFINTSTFCNAFGEIIYQHWALL